METKEIQLLLVHIAEKKGNYSYFILTYFYQSHTYILLLNQKKKKMYSLLLYVGVCECT